MRCLLTCEVSLPSEKPDIGFSILNLAGPNHLIKLSRFKPSRRDALVPHRLGLSRRETRRQIDRHLLAQESRTRIELRDLGPLLRAVPGLFHQFALSRLQ